MTKEASKYAFISSLYQTGRDLIDVFSFVVLQVFKNNSLTSTEIQDKIKTLFGSQFPLDVVKTLLKRLKRNGMVEYSSIENGVILTSYGHDRLNELKDSEENSERNFNALLSNVRSFAKQHGKSPLETEKIKQILYYVFQRYINNSSITPENENELSSGVTREETALLASYIDHINKNDPVNFERFKNLAVGVMLLSVFRNWKDDSPQNFGETSVYFDTNFVFSLLKLHNQELNQSAQELNELLVANKKLSRKVFWKTIDEIRGYLINYGNDSIPYSSTIAVDSVFGFLSRSGKTRQEVQILANTLEEKLVELGVEIDYFTEVDEAGETYKNAYSAMFIAKPTSNVRALEHDAWVITAIRKIRGRRISHLVEKSGAIFLSLDRRLLDVCRHGFGRDRIFPEVISPEFLSSILWLKNPGEKINFPVHNLVAGYTTEILISENTWKEFQQQLVRQQQEGQLSTLDVQLLISSKETEKLLLDIENHKEKIADLPELTRQLAKKFEDERKSREQKNTELETQLDLMSQELAETVSSIPELVNEGSNSAVEEYIKKDAASVAKLISGAIYWTIVIFLVVGVYLLALHFGLEQIGTMLGLVQLLAGIVLNSIKPIRLENIKNRMTVRIAKKIEKSKLQKLKSK